WPQSILRSSPFFFKTACSAVPDLMIAIPSAIKLFTVNSCDILFLAIAGDALKDKLTSCWFPSFDFTLNVIKLIGLEYRSRSFINSGERNFNDRSTGPQLNSYFVWVAVISKD